MTTLTINIPDTVAKQAQSIGLLNEKKVVQAFEQFVQSQMLSQSTKTKKPVKKRTIGTGVGTILNMPKNFNDTLDDFADYM